MRYFLPVGMLLLYVLGWCHTHSEGQITPTDVKAPSREEPTQLANSSTQYAPSRSLSEARNKLRDARQKNNEQEEALALSQIAQSHLAHGHPDSALWYINQAIGIGQRGKFTELEAILKSEKANIYLEIGDFAQAHTLIYESNRVFRDLNDTARLATGFINMAAVLHEQGELTDALDYLQQAHMLAGADPKLLAPILNRRGNIFMDIEQYEVARDNFMGALVAYDETGDSIGLAMTFTHLGQLYGKQENFEQAFDYVAQASRIQRSLGLDGDLAKSFLVQADLLRATGEMDRAAAQYLDALEIVSQTGDRTTHLQVLQGLAAVYLRQQKNDLTIYYGKEALDLAESLGSKADAMQAHYLLYQAYDRSGQTTSAYRHLKEYTALREQYLGYKEVQKIEAQKYQFDLLKKNNELEKMTLDKALSEEQVKAQKAEIQRQRTTTGWAIFGLMLALGIGVVLYLFYRSKQKSNQTLRKLNEEIIQQKRAIEEINQNLDKKVKTRTLELEQRNQQLIEYGLYNAHQIRGPLTNILGLIGLMKKHKPDSDTFPIIQKNLETSAKTLDKMVKEMNDILEGNGQTEKKPEHV